MPCKTALYRPFIPCDRGSHGLGKALHGSQYPGPFDSRCHGELSAGCGLAWRMLPGDWQQWQSKLDRNAFDAIATVEQ